MSSTSTTLSKSARAPNRSQPQSPFTPVPAGDRRKRRVGSSPCRSRSVGHSWRPICSIAVSKLSAMRTAAAVSSALLLSSEDDGSPTETWGPGDERRRDGSFRRHHRARIALGCSRRSARQPVYTSRRAMGNLLGNAVRFGTAEQRARGRRRHRDVLSCARLPVMPMAAALSANHLAAILFPPTLRGSTSARCGPGR